MIFCGKEVGTPYKAAGECAVGGVLTIIDNHRIYFIMACEDTDQGLVTDLSQWLSQMGVPEILIYSPAVPVIMLSTMIITGYRIFRG